MTTPAGCIVCGGRTVPHANGVVLGSWPATYLRCEACGLVTADQPDWLDVAYSDAIAAMDVGLLARSFEMSHLIEAVIQTEQLRSGTFLDWAGGYGTLTRLMRDRGLNFFHHDPYCLNLFASGADGSLNSRYDMVTAIEVLEHLVDPAVDLAPVAATTDRILITTLLLPSPPPRPGEWWYYTPETGQHVTFYTGRSLIALARRLGMTALSLNDQVHLFHRVPIRPLTRLLLRRPRVARYLDAFGLLSKPGVSLQQQDMESAKARSGGGDGPRRTRS